MLHVFQKDVRKLWWVAALTLALLGMLDRYDRWRSDYVPGSMEGWLNILAPFAWTVLIALLVLEEPLVGDRQFWITRPHRRVAVLAAKALFVLVFIHAAMFLGDCYILIGRGFSPLEYLPRLLWKQVEVGVAITLPAMALAALVRNVAHFMVLAVVAATAAIYAQGALGPGSAPWIPVDGVRRGIALIVVVLASVAIIAVQYGRRKTTIARVIGIAGAAVAMGLYAWTPRQFTASVEAKLRPLAGAKLELSLFSGPSESLNARLGRRAAFSIPLALSGLPSDEFSALEQLSLEIAGSDGTIIRAVPLSEYRRPDRADTAQARIFARPPVSTAAFPIERDRIFENVTLDPALYERLKSGTVTLRGEAAASVYRPLSPVSIPAIGRERVPGIGSCYSMVTDDRLGDSSRLKLVCESPNGVLPLTTAEVVRPGGLKTVGRLGSAFTMMGYPTSTWLSPIDRLQTAFEITDHPERYLVQIPRAALPSTELLIHPMQLAGRQVVRYEIRGIRLADYELKPLLRP